MRNRPDSTVEVVLEGEAEKIEQMIAWLHIGSPQAEVKEVQVTEEQPLDDKTAFAIRYNWDKGGQDGPTLPCGHRTRPS